jgi:hypothetical protein
MIRLIVQQKVLESVMRNKRGKKKKEILAQRPHELVTHQVCSITAKVISVVPRHTFHFTVINIHTASTVVLLIFSPSPLQPFPWPVR